MITTRSVIIFLLIIFSLCFETKAQNKSEKNIQKAVNLVQQHKDEQAIKLLNQTIEDYPQEADAYLFLAEIYFSRNDFRQSLNYYLQASERNSSYKETSSERITFLQRKVFVMDSLMNNPVEFNPISLGHNINDTSDQYLPTLTIDEQLYFTQRQDNKEDFYYADLLKQADIPSWSQKHKLPYPLNSDDNEGAASISPDGMYLYFAKCSDKEGYGSCDIYRCKKEGNSWSKPENLGENVNSKAWDSQPTIASDGRTLFFASNREGGFGGSDIWYTYLKDDGTWTKAKNCGNKINSIGMEISPFIHPSNQTLYFASDFWDGMGGLDIFFSKIINGKFQTPQNIGYPINTPDNESCLIVSPNAQYAIYAKQVEQEKNDLYAFKLQASLQPTPVICMKGKITYDDNKKNNSAKLTIKNLKTGKIVTQTYSDKINNEYRLTLPLEENYALSVTCEGYLLYSESFSLKHSSIKDNKYIIKDIDMQAIKTGASIVLNNIFFENNSFELKQESFVELQTIQHLLEDNANLVVEIAGFTDNVGSDEYNIKLSQQRAESVKSWLVDNGIDAQRIIAKGYGKQNPRSDNSTAQGRQLNRRTEFKILSINK